MNLKVLRDFAEVIRYENSNLPLFASTGRLSNFSNMRALGHWHEDVEIIKPVHGNISYDVNGRKFFVREGDALIVNSKQMHYGFSADGSDCEYLCVLFQPQILTGNDFIKTKYIDSIIRQPYITETYLNQKNPAHKNILQLTEKFFDFPQIEGYELNFLNLALKFWQGWYEILKTAPIINYKIIDRNIDVQKNMVEFIYKNYRTKITLEQIARSGGVCKSLCCQIFKKYLDKSPINFLNNYRLQIGMNLLSDSKISVTEISELCGFNSPSYFSEMFLKYKGCSPSDYRKKTFGAGDFL